MGPSRHFFPVLDQLKRRGKIFSKPSDSKNNKIDDLLDVRREQQIDVLFLTETWHDSDSVSIRRLRADGFQVIERARPHDHVV